MLSLDKLEFLHLISYGNSNIDGSSIDEEDKRFNDIISKYIGTPRHATSCSKCCTYRTVCMYAMPILHPCCCTVVISFMDAKISSPYNLVLRITLTLSNYFCFVLASFMCRSQTTRTSWTL